VLTDDDLRLCREAWNAAQTNQSGDRFAPDVLRLVMLVNKLHTVISATPTPPVAPEGWQVVLDALKPFADAWHKAWRELDGEQGMPDAEPWRHVFWHHYRDAAAAMLRISNAPTPPVAPWNAAIEAAARDTRQKQVADWCAAAFGTDQAASIQQRGVRLLEEAVEVYQACGCDPAMAHKLVDYVFSRPPGTIQQELGGVGVTVLALANAAGISADKAESDEVARVLSKPLAHFTARNQAKNDAGFRALAQPDAAKIGEIEKLAEAWVEAAVKWVEAAKAFASANEGSPFFIELRNAMNDAETTFRALAQPDAAKIGEIAYQRFVANGFFSRLEPGEWSQELQRRLDELRTALRALPAPMSGEASNG